MIKIRHEYHASKEEVSIVADIAQTEIMEKSGPQIYHVAMDMIATRLCDLFCQKYGQELIDKIDKEKVIQKVLNSEYLENQEKINEAIISGRCLGCSRKVRDWVAPSGSFAPEQCASMEERGIDAMTGHLKDCKYNK